MNFPILVFFKSSLPTFFINEERFKITNVLALKKKMFDNVTVIDSSGRKFIIKSAYKVRGFGFLYGYNIFFNQKIKIDFNLIESDNYYSVEDLKKKVLKTKYFQDIIGGDDIIYELSKCTSIREFFTKYSVI